MVQLTRGSRTALTARPSRQPESQATRHFPARIEKLNPQPDELVETRLLSFFDPARQCNHAFDADKGQLQTSNPSHSASASFPPRATDRPSAESPLAWVTADAKKRSPSPPLESNAPRPESALRRVQCGS